MRRTVASTSFALCALAAVCFADAAAAATPDELTDLEAKAQYAFYTGDLNAARSLAQANRALATSEVPIELYHYAHAQFRVLQLAARREDKPARREAEAAGEACVKALAGAIERDERFAEALALQSECYGYLATLGPIDAVTAAPRIGGKAEAAAKLNPKNPRVLLAQAFALYYRPLALGGARRQDAAPLFRRAAEAFDAIVATRPGEPTWGAAEAWLYVGRTQEEAGDLLAARNAYERALLVAPEFAAARQRLGALGGRR
jgi:tetratricopeptide (TPR) repeat protein